MESRTANMTLAQIVEQAREMAARRAERTPSDAPTLEMKPLGPYGDVGRKAPKERVRRANR